METNTSLRQAHAIVKVEGKISELNLQETYDEATRMNKISGNVVVKTDDINFVRFNVNVNAKTKAGADNKVYPGIKTVMNEYKSIAEYGNDAADLVRVTGDINPYRSKQSGQEIVGYKSNFFNRVTDPSSYEPKAEFEVEAYIQSIVPEIKNDMETGRLRVKTWMPTYNGIEPLDLYVEENEADAFEDIYKQGQTAEFYGNVINSKEEKTTEVQVAFGKPRQKKEITYKNELVITGGTEPYEEGVSQNSPYDPEAIRLAIQQREDKIKNQDNLPFTGSNGRPTATGTGRSLAGLI